MGTYLISNRPHTLTLFLDGGRVQGPRLFVTAAVLVLLREFLPLHAIYLILDLNPHVPLRQLSNVRMLDETATDLVSVISLDQHKQHWYSLISFPPTSMDRTRYAATKPQNTQLNMYIYSILFRVIEVLLNIE